MHETQINMRNMWMWLFFTMVVPLCYGGSFDHDEPYLEVKVFAIFVANLFGVYKMIVINEKSA